MAFRLSNKPKSAAAKATYFANRNIAQFCTQLGVLCGECVAVGQFALQHVYVFRVG